MKSIYCFLTVSLMVLLSGCSSGPQGLMLDSFEGIISKKTVDYGSSAGSSLKVTADKALKACGRQSMKLVYALKSSGYMWAARGFNLKVKGAGAWLVKPRDINWTKYNSFSFYMYGENTSGVIVFDIKDSGGEMWRFLVDDDFTGWKKIICPFSQFFVRKDWQPQNADNNGKLDFPIMSFQFEPLSPGKGSYSFDCVQLAKVKK